VGYNKVGRDLHNFLDLNPGFNYTLSGFFDDGPQQAKYAKMCLGKTDDCMDYVLNNKISEIFCTLPITESDKIKALLMEADKHRILFRFVPEYYDYGIKPVLIQNYDYIPIISARAEPLETLLNRFFKRLLDIGFSLFIIFFVFIWLFPILAILIKWESKGPIFFKQSRSGQGNKAFMCYKFRSMTVNQDSDTKQATRGDQRITKLGAFMRRTSIDELPQFFNVLIGNMSVVGPRPHMISHTAQYSKLIDKFMVRHFLKPGITGWAQVRGLRGETNTVKSMADRVEADVWYLENWSFPLDIKIIFLTVWNSVKGDKNAF
jgi:putative colanic acid biosynthesis UDP-glucose lipid carrier transferase